MDKRCGILLVSVTILFLCFVGTASATNWSVDGSGGADFTRIQDAINKASDGDRIMVHFGVYYENVVVDKSVTLRGIDQPVVDANGSDSAITLTADGITLVGFNATNSGRWRKDAGIKVTSNNNTITGNNVSNNNGVGISLYDSSNNTITGNNVSNNNGVGIGLYYSSNNTITGNNVSNNRGGITLGSSSNNTITGNNANNNDVGIYLWDSRNNTITNNTFVNDGLFVEDSYQNTVQDNTVNGKPLVYLEDASDYRVVDAGQVILRNCNNITVENLDLSNTSGGIALWKTENSKISNNTVCNNSYDGISLSSSSNNTITGNNVNNNNRGGISIYYSSSNNTITGNVFVNDGLSVYSSYQNIVEDNTVNGKPLVYLEDVSDYKVEDAGQVIIVNCNNITVENLDLTNTSVSIALLNTENSKISNNTVCSNNWGGIRLYDSSNNNTITGNNVGNNNYGGIRLDHSNNNNTITGNNVSNNKEGIRLWDSSNNKVYFNNFINNTDNVDSYRSTNIWNSPLEITYTYDGTTYKSYLGNYWDDYEGTDADGDGIGDTHYSIYSESDDYPLMTPFENYILPRSAPT